MRSDNIADVRPATVPEELVPALIMENQRLRQEIERLQGLSRRREIALRNFLAQYFAKFAEDMFSEIERAT